MGPSGRRVAVDRAELHVGHDRRSERCRLPPQGRLPQRHGKRARLQADARYGLPVDAADVPLQRLDLSVGGDAGGRHPCLPAPGGCGPHLRADRQRAGDAPVCRADRVEHADPLAGEADRALCALGGDRHRRRRAAERGDRAGGAPGLQHHAPVWPDRDLRAGHAVRLAARLGRLRSDPALRQDGAPGAQRGSTIGTASI